jgi:hypothetical protein
MPNNYRGCVSANKQSVIQSRGYSSKFQQLKTPSAGYLGGPLNKATGEIDGANVAIKRVRPVCRTGIMKAGVENIFAMRPRRLAIVNNEGKNNLARAYFPVRDIFTPDSAPDSISTEARVWAAAVAPAVSLAPRSLIGAMIGRGTTHSGRERERLLQMNSSKKTRGLVDGAQSFFHPPIHYFRRNEKTAI